MRVSKVWAIGAGLLLLTCKGEDTPSVEPKLQWVSNSVVAADDQRDSLVLVEFRYEDGDGDVGLEPSDTSYPFAYGDPYFYNFQVRYWHCVDGQWVRPLNPLQPRDTLDLSERLLNMTPTGKHKSIKGNLTLRLPAKPYQYEGDSVRFECRLIDRALHQSPWVLSDLVVLRLR